MKDFAGRTQGDGGRREADIGNRLIDHLLDFSNRAAVVDCAAHVILELVWGAQRNERAHDNHAAVLALQAGTRPHIGE